ncbi:MAG: hypothetical protein IPM17_18000 [Verrucomicrobia bacterium]|jgi:hypothetical protein|nr:hypothetical protein [Verrucomicrobiota bacterium]
MKTILLVLAIAVLTAAPLAAAESKSTPPPAVASDGAPKAKPKSKSEAAQPAGVPFNGKIAALDLSAQTLTLSGKAQRVVKVTSQTKILRDGQPATLAGAKVGESVGGYAKKTDEGVLEAISLRLGPKAPADKAAKPATGTAKRKAGATAE